MMYDAHANHKMPAADQSVLVELKPTRLARVHRADRRVGIIQEMRPALTYSYLA